MKPRASLMLLAVAAAGVGIAGFVWLKPADEGAPRVHVTVPEPKVVAVVAAPTVSAPAVAIAAPVKITDEQVAQWATDADGGDAAKRAAAIKALADAPTAQALPVLRRVLLNGEPSVDRPLALQSLRDLALNQGDPNGEIRNAVRAAIYHGDDQTLTADVQDTLDVIEESQMK